MRNKENYKKKYSVFFEKICTTSIYPLIAGSRVGDNHRNLLKNYFCYKNLTLIDVFNVIMTLLIPIIAGIECKDNI